MPSEDWARPNDLNFQTKEQPSDDYKESVHEKREKSKSFMKQGIIYQLFELRDQDAVRQLILNGLGEHFGSIHPLYSKCTVTFLRVYL